MFFIHEEDREKGTSLAWVMQHYSMTKSLNDVNLWRACMSLNGNPRVMFPLIDI